MKSENELLEFVNEYGWKGVSRESEMSEEFMDKYSDKLDWGRVSTYQTLSESFIEKHKNEVDWLGVSANQKLSESFIEKFKDRVDWANISSNQSLSESFIEKHQDKVVWDDISQYQKLSEEFIEKNKSKFPKDTWKYTLQDSTNISIENYEKTKCEMEFILNDFNEDVKRYKLELIKPFTKVEDSEDTYEYTYIVKGTLNQLAHYLEDYWGYDDRFDSCHFLDNKSLTDIGDSPNLKQEIKEFYKKYEEQQANSNNYLSDVKKEALVRIINKNTKEVKHTSKGDDDEQK
jgi:hypothetical protein